MRILISNDDGYQAEGLHVLAETLKELGEVIVVAPDRNRSGASNSLTLDSPLRIKKVKKNFYYVNGTPTDCVHLAITGFLDEKPDIVVSGINENTNLGDDVLYSGTVSAAIEGRSLGFPAIAVSIEPPGKNFKAAAEVTKKLIKQLIGKKLPAKTILNVNMQDKPLEELGKIEVTRLGTRHISQPAIRIMDPRGHEGFWIGLSGEEEDAGQGTDFHAVKAGNISVTPMRVEWTNFEAFERVSEWAEELNTQ